MYYKITNQESEVYKSLHSIRTKEIEIDKANKIAVKEKIGLEFDSWRGHQSQGSLWRTVTYSAFKFSPGQDICPKTWKEEKNSPGVYSPYARTKKGKEMRDFLNALQTSCFTGIESALGVEFGCSFRLPKVHLKNNAVYLFVDDKLDIQSSDIVEITRNQWITELS